MRKLFSTVVAAVAAFVCGGAWGADETGELPMRAFTWEPQLENLTGCSGWWTELGTGHEPFVATGVMTVGNRVIPVVKEGAHPWGDITAKDNYTLALYADTKAVAASADSVAILIACGNKNGYHAIVKNADGAICLTSKTGEGTVKTETVLGEGLHALVMTFDNTAQELKLYVDGALTQLSAERWNDDCSVCDGGG